MSAPYILHLGDCLEVLRSIPDNSIDSVVTDPPYGLAFMGKRWDYDVPSVEIWAECLRVLKPGGHLLAFAGTRTQHRMAVRIEDAGFEIRDMIAWVYGSGFPKSMDVSKAIDKAAGAEREVLAVVDPRGTFDGRERSSTAINNNWRESEGRSDVRDLSKKLITAPATDAARQWQGWGTALKPALEPITVARKPLAGTVAANALAHGTGALHIDACRIPAEPMPANTGSGGLPRRREHEQRGPGQVAQPHAEGRWPANLIHDGSDEVLAAFPDAPGQLADASLNSEQRKTQNVYGAMRRGREGEASANSANGGIVGFSMRPGARRLDVGSAARFFYCAKASRRDRNEGCEEMESRPLHWSSGDQNPGSFQSESTDKASQNHHPTVKPTDLMAYLCRLVTRPGGVVLDPFMGSGSTGKACMREGFEFIGIEREPPYLAIAEARIAHELGCTEAAEAAATASSAQLDIFHDEKESAA